MRIKILLGCVFASSYVAAMEQEQKIGSSLIDLSKKQFLQKQRLLSLKNEQCRLLAMTSDPGEQKRHSALIGQYRGAIASWRHAWIMSCIERLGIDEGGKHTGAELCRGRNHTQCFLPMSSAGCDSHGRPGYYVGCGMYDIYDEIRKFLVGSVQSGGHLIHSEWISAMASKRMLINRPGGEVSDISLSPNGDTIIVGYANGVLRQYNTARGGYIEHTFQGRLANSPINSILWRTDSQWEAYSLHPDGYFCSGNVRLGQGYVPTESVRARDMADEVDEVALQQMLESDYSLKFVLKNLQGTRKFEVEHDGTVSVYDIAQNGDQQLRAELENIDINIVSCSTNDAGNCFIAASASGRKYMVWRENGGQHLLELLPQDMMISPISVTMQRDGTCVVIVAHGKAHVFDLRDMTSHAKIELPHKEACHAAEFVMHMRALMTNSSTGTLRMHNLRDSVCISEMRPYQTLQYVMGEENRYRWVPEVHTGLKRGRNNKNIFMTYDLQGISDAVNLYDVTGMQHAFLQACTTPKSLYFISNLMGLGDLAKSAYQQRHSHPRMQAFLQDSDAQLIDSAPIGVCINNILSHLRPLVEISCTPIEPGVRIGHKRKQLDDEKNFLKRTK